MKSTHFPLKTQNFECCVNAQQGLDARAPLLRPPTPPAEDLEQREAPLKYVRRARLQVGTGSPGVVRRIPQQT